MRLNVIDLELDHNDRSTEYQQYRSLNTIEEEDETCDDKIMATTERYKNSTSSTGSGNSG